MQTLPLLPNKTFNHLPPSTQAIDCSQINFSALNQVNFEVGCNFQCYLNLTNSDIEYIKKKCFEVEVIANWSQKYCTIIFEIITYYETELKTIHEISQERIQQSHYLINLERKVEQLTQKLSKVRGKLEKTKVKLDTAQYQQVQLRGEIEGMKSNIFWKIRAKWLRIKQFLKHSSFKL